MPLRSGDLLSEAVEIAKRYESVDAMCIMHSDVRLTERGIEVLRAGWDGPICAYAHAAQESDGDLYFEDNISPQEYADYEPAWVNAGASIIGGCCGIGPKHMAALVNQ